MKKLLFKVFSVCFGAFLVILATPSAAQTTSPPATDGAVPWRRFSNNNGPLSAELFIISKSQLEEFEKPSTEGVYLTPLTQAHVGDIVAIKVLFNGAGVSPENTFNVTFDIKIFAPDGRTYDGLDKYNLPAYIGPVGNLNNIYDNVMTMIGIRFEPQDAAGDYRVELTLRDNVSGRKIMMTKSIRLIKE